MPGVEFRPAAAGDAVALRDLEREANLQTLGHVFPPEHFPYPDAGVLARWREVLADGQVMVEVVDGSDGLACFAAYDATTLRHLAVRPSRWGTGLARAAVERAVDVIRAGGETPRLWCLQANERAFALDRHLGWELTGAERTAEWPPYPMERELVLVQGSAT